MIRGLFGMFYFQNYSNKQYGTHSPPYPAGPVSRLMYSSPLTPPSSDPGSPGNTLQVLT